jgi:hypothetical protein
VEHHLTPCLLVLDPRISFDGLLQDCAGDNDATDHIQSAKDALKEYFDTYYAISTTASRPSASQVRVIVDPSGSPQKVDFTAHYQRSHHAVDELAEYLRQPPESFDTCNPVKWWAARVSQFPNLSRLARDILTIPGTCYLLFQAFMILWLNERTGSAVAVERVFSGGRDTIGIRRSRLSASTIRILMLLKHQLRLKREAAIAELTDLTE